MAEYPATRHFQNQSGFTLIEAMIAFIVLAAGMVALLSFHSAIQTGNAEAKTRAEAVAFAEAKLQQLESYLNTADDRLVDGADQEDGLLTTFELEWTVTENTPDESLRTASVTVTWTDRSGNEQSVVLSSEIHVKEPASDVENLMSVVKFTRDQQSANGWYLSGGPEGEGGQQGPDGEANDGDQNNENGSENGDEGVNVQHDLVIIQGSISKDKQSQMLNVVGDGNFLPDCSFENSSETTGQYRCQIKVAKGSLWTGGIKFNTNKVICTAMSGQYSSEGRKAFSGIGSDQRFDVQLAKNKQGC